MVYPIHAMIEFALNPLYTVYASFLVFFYTDTIGVDAGIVGIVILVSNLRPYFKSKGAASLKSTLLWIICMCYSRLHLR